MRTLDIFRLNQLLFLEAGFIHLNSIISGAFVPLWGITFLFVSIATYFTMSFLGVMLGNHERVYEDFVDVFRSNFFPSSYKSILACIVMTLTTIPLVLFYNLDLVLYPINSIACTLIATIIGCLAYIFVSGDVKRLAALLVFSVLSIPVTALSLVVGGVVTLPLLLIFLYRRT